MSLYFCAMNRSCEYTLPAGEPRMRLLMAALACLMLPKLPASNHRLPIRWIFESAKIILVLVAFSMAFFVLPCSPEIRPMARLKWSPCSGLTG